MATVLFDGGRIGLGLAAQIAGLAYSEMVNELTRREIAVIRPALGEFDREVAALGD